MPARSTSGWRTGCWMRKAKGSSSRSGGRLEGAEREHRRRVADPGHLLDLVGDEIAEVVVRRRVELHEEIVGPRYRMDLRDALELHEGVRHLLEAAQLALHEDERGLHRDLPRAVVPRRRDRGSRPLRARC